MPALLATQPRSNTFETPLHGLRAATLAGIKEQLQDWAAKSGFAVSFLRTRSNGTADAICKMGGEQRPDSFLKSHPEARQRHRRSVKTGCRFLVRISRLDNDFFASTAMGESLHNHPRLPQGAFSEQKALSQRCLDALGPLVDEGRQPRDIKNILRSRFAADMQFVPMKTIYNAIEAYKRQRALHNDVEAISRDLSAGTYPNDLVRLFLSQRGRAVGVFFATRRSRALTRCYLSSFSVDCTYKTNLYGLPLLEIAGLASTGQSFTSAVAVILNEDDQWYDKAIETWMTFMGLGGNVVPASFATDDDIHLRKALAKWFPDSALLLCIYHVRENILKHKGQLSNEEAQVYLADWASVSDAWTTKALQAALDALNSKYDYRQAPAYHDIHLYALERTDRDAAYFIPCFTNRHHTLGVRASSRVEGKHAALKRQLSTSKGNLLYLLSMTRTQIEHEWTEITLQMATEMTDNGGRFPRLQQVIAGHVSLKAMRLIQQQYRLFRAREDTEQGAEGEAQRCTGGWRRSMGLPCWHELKALVQEGDVLDVPMIHEHWRLSSAEEILLCAVNEYCPAPVRSNGALVDGSQVYNGLQAPAVVIRKRTRLNGSQVEILPGDDIDTSAVVFQRDPRLGSRSNRREPTGRELNDMEEQYL